MLNTENKIVAMKTILEEVLANIEPSRGNKTVITITAAREI